MDYDYITLGTPEKFLLPVRAEILSCNRGSNECERNVIEFRNYHKSRASRLSSLTISKRTDSEWHDIFLGQLHGFQIRTEKNASGRAGSKLAAVPSVENFGNGTRPSADWPAQSRF